MVGLNGLRLCGVKVRASNAGVAFRIKVAAGRWRLEEVHRLKLRQAKHQGLMFSVEGKQGQRSAEKISSATLN